MVQFTSPYLVGKGGYIARSNPTAFVHTAIIASTADTTTRTGTVVRRGGV